MKRHWGRLLWVTITNLPIFFFSIHVLIGIHQEDVRINFINPPPPSFLDVLHDNPHFALALILTGAGFLLEALKRREAGLINCSFWLALCIYGIAQREPLLSTCFVIGLFIVNLIWYVVPAWRVGATGAPASR